MVNKLCHFTGAETEFHRDVAENVLKGRERGGGGAEGGRERANERMAY